MPATRRAVAMWMMEIWVLLPRYQSGYPGWGPKIASNLKMENFEGVPERRGGVTLRHLQNFLS